MNFQELKSFFKNELDIYRLKDIASELNVSPQAVNNWKMRNHVPHKITLLIQEKYNYGKDNEYKNKKNTLRLEFPEDFVRKDNVNISLFDFYFILKKKILFILTFSIFISSLTIIYVQFFYKSVYTSTATIIPVSNDGSVSKMAGIAATFGISVPSNGSGVKMVYPEIVKSKTIAKKILSKDFKSSKYDSKMSLLKLLKYPDEDLDDEVDFERLLLEGVDMFIKNISISENIKTSIVTLSVESSEPKLAADIAKALILELDLHQKKFQTEQVVKKRIFIEERIKAVNIILVKSEEALKDFRVQNRNYSDSPNLLLEFERLLRELEVQKQLYITLKREYEMAQIKEVEDSDILHILDEPETPLSRTRPKKKIIVILATFFSFSFGVILTLMESWYIDNKRQLSA